MMNVVQYTPWIDCNVGCKFCTNRNQPDVDKFTNLSYIYSLVNSETDLDQHDGIGLIGGDFFQHQLDDINVKKLWYKLTNKLVELLQQDKIKILWIATSLIYKPNKLYNWLDYLKQYNVLDRVLLCTSYDVVYRFNDTSLKLWTTNMKQVQLKYPQLKIHTEMILTQELMSRCINNKFDILEFEKQYNTIVDFIEPHTGFSPVEYYKNELPLFLPKRSTTLQFLNTIVKNWDSNRVWKFLNPRIRSATIYHIQNGQMVKICDRYNTRMEDQAVGIKPVVGYCDSSRSIIDDVEMWKNNG